jgi:hypothetical protein
MLRNPTATDYKKAGPGAYCVTGTFWIFLSLVRVGGYFCHLYNPSSFPFKPLQPLTLFAPSTPEMHSPQRFKGRGGSANPVIGQPIGGLAPVEVMGRAS